MNGPKSGDPKSVDPKSVDPKSVDPKDSDAMPDDEAEQPFEASPELAPPLTESEEPQPAEEPKSAGEPAAESFTEEEEEAEAVPPVPTRAPPPLAQAWQGTPPPQAAGVAPQAAQQAAPQGDTAGIGVLLVNLGTPEAPTAAAVRTYLTEFLNDKRVIEDTSLRWRIVKSLVLRLRPKRKARDYAKIWDRALNESPLKVITRAQAEKLTTMVASLAPHVTVKWAMRYGQPSIASKLDELMAHGCDRVLVAPLYPQYAAATTATVGDEVFRALMRMRRQPAIRMAAPYYDDPVYIEALASSLKAAIRGLDFEPDMILASYHGIPLDYAKKGDPYPKQCETTTRLLREKLGLDEASVLMSFQSRFGRAQWLEPYTDATVKRLARSGTKNLVVLTPGFAADCLETLEEIALENAHLFKRHGGRNFAAVPCLNDSEVGMQVIGELVLRELKGWV